MTGSANHPSSTHRQPRPQCRWTRYAQRGRGPTGLPYSVPVTPDAPLRIAVLSWRDQRHPEAGGAEVFLDRVTADLTRRGHSVTIFTARYAGSLPDEILHDGRRIIRGGGRLTVYPRAAMALMRRRRAFDAVIDVQNGVPFWSPAYSRAPIVCIVHHVHHEQWAEVFAPTTAAIGWTLESRVAPAVYRGCQFLVVSRSTAGDLEEIGVPAGRIHVAYSGLDPQPDIRQYDPLGPPRLLVLGRLVPHKRVELALRALSVMRSQFPDLSLDIAGQGYHEEQLIRFADELGVRQHVRFAGRVSELEKLQLYSRATVHLLPSLKEGWGLTVVEAAYQGTPTVAFRSAGGTAESIVDGQTGLLADSEEEFIAMASRIVGDADLRSSLSSRAREHARAFTWAATTDAVEGLLRRQRRSTDPETIQDQA